MDPLLFGHRTRKCAFFNREPAMPVPGSHLSTFCYTDNIRNAASVLPEKKSLHLASPPGRLVLSYISSQLTESRERNKMWILPGPSIGLHSTVQGMVPTRVRHFWTLRNYVGLQRLQITLISLARLCLASRRPLMKFRLKPCSFRSKMFP